MNITFGIISCIIILAACNTASNNPDVVSVEKTKVEEHSGPTVGTVSAPTDTMPQEKDKLHSTEGSVDWMGLYIGRMEYGGRTKNFTLTLNADKTFVLDDGKEQKGTFTWDAAGQEITLEGVKNNPSKFFVGEGYVAQVDATGKHIDNDSTHTLRKKN